MSDLIDEKLVDLLNFDITEPFALPEELPSPLSSFILELCYSQPIVNMLAFTPDSYIIENFLQTNKLNPVIIQAIVKAEIALYWIFRDKLIIILRGETY